MSVSCLLQSQIPNMRSHYPLLTHLSADLSQNFRNERAMSDDEGELFEMLELLEKVEPEGAGFDRDLGLDDYDLPVFKHILMFSRQILPTGLSQRKKKRLLARLVLAGVQR